MLNPSLRLRSHPLHVWPVQSLLTMAMTMMMILLYITTMTISPQQHFDDGKPTRDRGAPERRHTVTYTLVQHLGLWYDRSYDDGMKVICDGGYDGDVVTPTPWIDVLMLPQYMFMKYDGTYDGGMQVICDGGDDVGYGPSW